jgi:glycosyltransferase involved in cell wall biosynthesis
LSDTGRVHRLAVITHVQHHVHDGAIWAYGPYLRELQLWADAAEQVEIAAPVEQGPPPDGAGRLDHADARLVALPPIGGPTTKAKLASLARLPAMVVTLSRLVRRVDVVHVRLPGSTGVLGALVASAWRRPRVAKYAGVWAGDEGTNTSWRWQRRMLRSWVWGAPVTVYGKHADDPWWVLDFFSASLGADELARTTPVDEPLRDPVTVLFVGRLSAAKHADASIAAAEALASGGIDARARLVGDGPERGTLEARAASATVPVEVAGAVATADMPDELRAADVLVLVSDTEGWPKALVEAMGFGLVVVGADRGVVPRMLGHGRGLVVPAGDGAGAGRALLRTLGDPGTVARMRRDAQAWARRFTVDEMQRGIRRSIAVAQAGSAESLEELWPTNDLYT